MGKIKVLFISQSTGGVQRHVIGLAANMDRSRFELTGICPPEDLVGGVSPYKESFVAAFKRVGVRVKPVRMCREIRPHIDVVSFLKIYNFIKDERFDIVHTFSSKAGFLGRIAAKMAGVKVIIHTPQSFAFDRPSSMLFQRIIYALLEKIAGCFCDRIIAVCEEEKQFAVKMRVVPLRKIDVISNAIQLPIYDANIDIAKKRQELGLSAADKVILWLCRFAAQKAPLDFVKAAGVVHKAFASTKFLMAGDGPLQGRITRYVEKNNLSGFIKILGWRNDVHAITVTGDLFVLSSLWEVLPNHALLDAMALGKPVVITNTCGAGALVIDGYNGFLVPKGRPDLIAQAVIKILSMPPEKMVEMGRGSKEIFEKQPLLEEFVRQLEGIYTKALLKKEDGV